MIVWKAVKAVNPCAKLCLKSLRRAFTLRKVFAQRFGQPVTINFGFMCSILSSFLVRFDNHNLVDGLVGNDCIRYQNHCFNCVQDRNWNNFEILFAKPSFVSLIFPILLFINMLNHDLHSYAQILCAKTCAKSLGKDFEQGFKTLRKVFAQEMC